MFTLWILILGLKNELGQTVLSKSGRPAMQAIATYHTVSECTSSAKTLYKFLNTHSAGVDVICLPTGVSDPVGQKR